MELKKNKVTCGVLADQVTNNDKEAKEKYIY